nr:hypothetical protein [Anthocerotibacter panamensis]
MWQSLGYRPDPVTGAWDLSAVPPFLAR